MDIAVTLLQILHASNDINGYAFGWNLFDESPRDFVVVIDWHSIAGVADDFKYRIPHTSRGMENYKPAHRNDSMFSSSALERCEIEAHKNFYFRDGKKYYDVCEAITEGLSITRS